MAASARWARWNWALIFLCRSSCLAIAGAGRQAPAAQTAAEAKLALVSALTFMAAQQNIQEVAAAQERIRNARVYWYASLASTTEKVAGRAIRWRLPRSAPRPRPSGMHDRRQERRTARDYGDRSERRVLAEYFHKPDEFGVLRLVDSAPGGGGGGGGGGGHYVI